MRQYSFNMVMRVKSTLEPPAPPPPKRGTSVPPTQRLLMLPEYCPCQNLPRYSHKVCNYGHSLTDGNERIANRRKRLYGFFQYPLKKRLLGQDDNVLMNVNGLASDGPQTPAPVSRPRRFSSLPYRDKPTPSRKLPAFQVYQDTPGSSSFLQVGQGMLSVRKPRPLQAPQHMPTSEAGPSHPLPEFEDMTLQSPGSKSIPATPRDPSLAMFAQKHWRQLYSPSAAASSSSSGSKSLLQPQKPQEEDPDQPIPGSVLHFCMGAKLPPSFSLPPNLPRPAPIFPAVITESTKTKKSGPSRKKRLPSRKSSRETGTKRPLTKRAREHRAAVRKAVIEEKRKKRLRDASGEIGPVVKRGKGKYVVGEEDLKRARKAPPHPLQRVYHDEVIEGHGPGQEVPDHSEPGGIIGVF